MHSSIPKFESAIGAWDNVKNLGYNLRSATPTYNVLYVVHCMYLRVQSELFRDFHDRLYIQTIGTVQYLSTASLRFEINQMEWKWTIIRWVPRFY